MSRKVRKVVLVDAKNFTHEINSMVDEANVAPETIKKSGKTFKKEEVSLAEVIIYRET